MNGFVNFFFYDGRKFKQIKPNAKYLFFDKLQFL